MVWMTCDWFNFKCQQAAWLNRRAELCALNRHEINELATSCETKRLHRKNSRRLSQCFNDLNTGHNRTSGEMPLKKALVDRHGLNSAN